MNKTEIKQVNKIVLDHINDMENNAEKENPVYVKEKKDFDGKYKAIEEELRTMLKDLKKKYDWLLKDAKYTTDLDDVFEIKQFNDDDNIEHWITDESIEKECQELTNEWNQLLSDFMFAVSKEAKQDAANEVKDWLKMKEIKVVF